MKIVGIVTLVLALAFRMEPMRCGAPAGTDGPSGWGLNREAGAQRQRGGTKDPEQYSTPASTNLDRRGISCRCHGPDLGFHFTDLNIFHWSAQDSIWCFSCYENEDSTRTGEMQKTATGSPVPPYNAQFWRGKQFLPQGISSVSTYKNWTAETKV